MTVKKPLPLSQTEISWSMKMQMFTCPTSSFFCTRCLPRLKSIDMILSSLMFIYLFLLEAGKRLLLLSMANPSSDSSPNKGRGHS